MNECLMIVFLMSLSAFFSASEASLMRVNRYKIQVDAKRSSLAKITLGLLKRIDYVLAVILLGNTFANILSGTYIASVLKEGNFSEAVIYMSPIIMSIAVFMFAEVLPKTLASRYAESVCYLISPIISLCLFLSFPFIYCIIQLNNKLIHFFGVRLTKKPDVISIEEYKLMVEEGMQEQKQYHHPLMMGVIELREKNVNDIMIDRSQIEFLNLEHDLDKIKNQIINCEHAELPVVDGDIENIIGVISIKESIRLLIKNKFDLINLRKNVKHPYFIPEKTPLHTQLIKFHQLQRKTALVVDEYGHLQGLLSINSIFKEICDLDFAGHNYSDGIKKINKHSWVIWGHVSLRELKKRMDWDFPECSATKLSGALIEYLECIPQEKTSILFGKNVFEVLEVSQNTILRVKVTELDYEPEMNEE